MVGGGGGPLAWLVFKFASDEDLSAAEAVACLALLALVWALLASMGPEMLI